MSSFAFTISDLLCCVRRNRMRNTPNYARNTKKRATTWTLSRRLHSGVHCVGWCLSLARLYAQSCRHVSLGGARQCEALQSMPTNSRCRESLQGQCTGGWSMPCMGPLMPVRCWPGARGGLVPMLQWEGYSTAGHASSLAASYAIAPGITCLCADGYSQVACDGSSE